MGGFLFAALLVGWSIILAIPEPPTKMANGTVHRHFNDLTGPVMGLFFAVVIALLALIPLTVDRQNKQRASINKVNKND